MTDDKRLTKSLPVLLGECAKEVAESAAENERLQASVTAWREKHHARAEECDQLAARLVGVADENRRLRAKVQAVRDELRKACDETAPPDAYLEADTFQAGAWRMLRDRIDELLAAIGDGDEQ